MCYMRTGRRGSDFLGPSTLRLVKSLEIELDERAIYSGKALRMLLSAPYEGYTFPLARRLLLTLVWDKYDGSDELGEYADIDPLVAKASLSAFVERIKHIAHTVSDICVQPGANSLDTSGIASHHFGDLISQLYRLADCVEYHCRDDGHVLGEVQFNDICTLACIVCIGEGLGHQFIKLARWSAPTLQSLTINTVNGEAPVSGLIRNVDGSCVVFPCLLKLKLSMRSDNDGSILLDSNGPAQFPYLRRLDLHINSKIDMYVFFRGNTATLEFLDLTLDTSMVSMVRRYNLFTPTSHPNLKCVKIGYRYTITPGIFATPFDFLQFALDIGSRAPVREIRDPFPGNSLLPAYPSLGQHDCIQVLSLAHTPLVFWDAIVLIKKLPLLSDLHSGLVSLGAIPIGITRNTIAAYVCATYAPMGERFRRWQFYCDFRSDVSPTVECVLLLALACPDFNYAAPHTIGPTTFYMSMHDAVSSDMFKDYADRLQRFLPYRDC